MQFARKKSYSAASLITNVIVASEASSDTIFGDSWTKRAPANGKKSVPADIIASQTKIHVGWLAG